MLSVLPLLVGLRANDERVTNQQELRQHHVKLNALGAGWIRTIIAKKYLLFTTPFKKLKE
jgi:hypothetical protein